MQPAENAPIELGHRLDQLHAHPAIDCQPSEQVWTKITQRLDQRQTSAKVPQQPLLLRLTQPQWLLSVAASVLLLLGFAWFALQPIAPTVQPTISPITSVEKKQQISDVPPLAELPLASFSNVDANIVAANHPVLVPAIATASQQSNVRVMTRNSISHLKGENGPHYYFQQGMQNFHQAQYCLSKDHLTKARSFLCEHDKLTHEIEQFLEAIDNQIEPPCLCMVDRPECNY